jgi:hypothetical protein
MKNLLKSTNLMWAAIAVLAVMQFCPALGIGKSDGHSDAMRQRMNRMGQMRGNMGAKWDGMKEKRQAPQRQGRHKKEEK